GSKSADLAGRIGDGFIGTSPKAELLQGFEASGGKGKPHYGEVTVCWAKEEAEAKRIAYKHWPTVAIKGELAQELPTPAHFEQAADMVTEDNVAQEVVCGPDPERHLAAIRKYADAGYDHIWVHQVGPEQEGFLQFYEQ